MKRRLEPDAFYENGNKEPGRVQVLDKREKEVEQVNARTRGRSSSVFNSGERGIIGGNRAPSENREKKKEIRHLG